MCFLSTNVQSRNSLKVTNGGAKCCLVVESGSTRSSVVYMHRPSDKDVRDAPSLLIFPYVVPFILSSFKRRSDHPHADPRRAEYIFRGCESRESFVSSPALPKVFLVVGLKWLRGGISVCSGKTPAPAALTVIPLRRHSMTLFRNINIYTTRMLILRTSKYPVENVFLFRNAREIFFFNSSLRKMDVKDMKSIQWQNNRSAPVSQERRLKKTLW